MTKIINSNEEKQKDILPLATDRECRDRRSLLVLLGVIKSGNKSEIIFRKDALPVVSTRKTCRVMREKLIEREIIQPIRELKDGNITFCKLPPRKKRRIVEREEGEYKPRPIETDEDYYRRRQVYFRMIQEILYSRKKLKLILGKKKDDDPDWYF